jgi:hypothetical protein
MYKIRDNFLVTLTDRIISLLTNTCEISEIYKHFFANTVKKITEFLGERAIFDRKRDDNIPFFIDSTDYTIPPRKEKPMQNGNAYENVRQEENKYNCNSYTIHTVFVEIWLPCVFLSEQFPVDNNRTNNWHCSYICCVISSFNILVNPRWVINGELF